MEEDQAQVTLTVPNDTWAEAFLEWFRDTGERMFTDSWIWDHAGLQGVRGGAPTFTVVYDEDTYGVRFLTDPEDLGPANPDDSDDSDDPETED